nr:ASCH domain-containing protein [Luteimonas saliphila]
MQPWAWLIVHGPKDVENRDWRTGYRGPILIHAGKKWGPEQRDDLARVREEHPEIALPDEFKRGGFVGAATIVDCVDRMDSAWYVGEYGFVLADRRPIPKFISYKGQLGIFHVPREALSELAP